MQPFATLFLLIVLPALAGPAAEPMRGGPIGAPRGGIMMGVGGGDRVIVRVPRVEDRAPRVSDPTTDGWREKKGPDCFAVNQLAGVALTRAGSVDLVLQGGLRLRARLADDCAGLDFYRNFYLRPSADGQVCAERDAIRSRSGESCRIARLRILEPRR